MAKNSRNIFKTLSFIVVLSLTLVISACGNKKTDQISSESSNEANKNSSQFEHAEDAPITLEGICIKNNLFLDKEDGYYSLIYVTANDKTEPKPGNKYSFKIDQIMTSFPAQANTDELKLLGSATGEKLPWESLETLQTLPEYANLPVHLIDVRNEDEFKEGHVPNSLNISLSNISSIEKTIPKTDVIVVYCRSGNRSETAAKELEKLGYNLVFDLGGIQDYKGEIEK